MSDVVSSASKQVVDAKDLVATFKQYLNHRAPGGEVSTLRWLCKHKPELVGAQKHEGVWYIDRAKFERYMTTSDREVPLESRDDRSAGAVVEAA